ncbi:MAG TPA: RpiB/LacA/LacB family sugar-phosphate isomerase [Gemmatimonadaceae bacterium]
MIVAAGFDHAGFPLKEPVFAAIRDAGHEVLDCGAYALHPDDDYPDFAERVSRAVLDGEAERGILVCGSGVGAAVAATKLVGIRSALCHDTFSARQGVEDDAMNVLSIGARVIGPALAAEVIRAFLHAEFSGLGRHRRRLEKIKRLEASPR